MTADTIEDRIAVILDRKRQLMGEYVNDAPVSDVNVFSEHELRAILGVPEVVKRVCNSDINNKQGE